MKNRAYMIIMILLIIFLTITANTQISTTNTEITILNPRITISSVGDIMCHKSQYLSVHKNNTYDFSQWFKPITPYIKDADLSICNLETVFAGEEYAYSTYPRFNTPSTLAQAIKDAGFDVIATANNHSLDKGNHGIINTIDVLNSLELSHTGTYINKTKDNSILYKEIDNIKIAILNYTYGTNGLPIPKDNPNAVNIIDLQQMISDIESAREEASDLIIFVLHFGEEYQRNQSHQQSDLAETLFFNGAHIILGSHPHVIQPKLEKQIINKYGEPHDCFAIFSQGNFISNQRKQYRDSGLITNIEVIKDLSTDRIRILGVDYIPTWVDKSYTNGTVDFRVVSVSDAIANYEQKSDTKINKSDYKRLKQVLQETKNQLNK